MNEWAIIGLIYDIVGVFVLGFALAITTVKDLAAQAAAHYGYNPSAFDSLVNQRTDAWFGVSLLALGFMMQALGATGIAFPEICWIILPIILGLLCVALVPMRKCALKQARRKRDEFRQQAEQDKKSAKGA